MKDEQFDLILTGLQSDDQGFAQTGVILAERLGLPHATIIMEVQVDGGTAPREARARRRLVPVGRDAAAGGADDPERHQPAALRDAQGHHGGEEEGDPQGRGAAGARRRDRRSSASTCRRKAKKTQIIGGSPAEAAKELVRRLREEARVDRMILVDRRTARRQAQSRDVGNHRRGAAAGAGDRRSPITDCSCPAPSVGGVAAGARGRAGAGGRHRRARRRSSRTRRTATPRRCRQAIAQLSPSHVLLPHTYQTRDFAPKLAARLDRALITDVTGDQERPAARPRSCGRCSRAS